MQYNRVQCKQEQSEPESAKPSEDKKKVRRTKKDDHDRNFTCPCGKSYLSYPALYTHVKTKHKGKNNYLDPRSGKEDAGGSGSKVGDKVQQDNRNCLECIGKAVNSFFSEGQKYYQQNMGEDISPLVGALMEGVSTLEMPVTGNQTVYSILGHFLHSVKDYITGEQGQAYMKHFTYNLIAFINEWEKNAQHCCKATGENLPNYFNDFILSKRPPHSDQGGKTQSNSLVLACKVLLNLGGWLMEQGYTSLQIKYNPLG